MFMYTQIFYAYIVDVVAFDQHLNGLQFLGGAITLVFSILAAMHKKFFGQSTTVAHELEKK